MIPQHSNATLSNSRSTTPVGLPSSSRDLILPPSVKDFSLPLKPFRIPFLHTKDARIAVVNENEKLKRPSTASSIGRTESSLALGIRTQVTESRNANALSSQASHGFLSRPSTALSSSSSASTMRPKSVGNSRNRSLTDHELDRIEAEKRRLDDRLISMKEILNDMNAQSKFMDEELKRLQFKSTILDKDLLDCDVDAEHRLVQSLHAIQTKTEYWIQSLKEEELYTNTLALVFERNSSKRVDVESKYSAAQSELAHYDHDLHVMSIRLHQAKLEQAAAEKAYNSFAEEISNWRKQRDSQMASRSKQVSDMRLESISASQQVEGNPVLSSAIHSEAESFASVSDSQSKRSLQDGMLQMKRLTQQESALSIAASYNNCIERTQMFLEEEENTKQRIADCKSQKEMLSRKLELLKYGGDDSDANADQIIRGRTAKLEKKSAEYTVFVSNAEMQFASLKTGLQNLQNRLQFAPAVDTSNILDQEVQTSKILSSIGNITCLGLYDTVVRECVQMIVSSESRILQMSAGMKALPNDAKDIISQYQKELYAVDATARPHNVRVVIESPSARRQKFYQEQLDVQQHIEAEAESMRMFRTSLKQSAVTAEKKGSAHEELISAPASLVTKSRRSTIA